MRFALFCLAAAGLFAQSAPSAPSSAPTGWLGVWAGSAASQGKASYGFAFAQLVMGTKGYSYSDYTVGFTKAKGFSSSMCSGLATPFATPGQFAFFLKGAPCFVQTKGSTSGAATSGLVVVWNDPAKHGGKISLAPGFEFGGITAGLGWEARLALGLSW